MLNFILGLLSSVIIQLLIWFKGQRDKEDNLKTFNELIFFWIQSSKVGIDLQVESIKKLSINIKESKYLQIEEFGYTEILINKLNEFPMEKYFNSFVLNHEVIEKNSISNENTNTTFVYNIFSQSQFISKVDIATKDFFNQYKKQVLKLLTDFIEIDKQIIKIIFNHRNRIGENNTPNIKDVESDFLLTIDDAYFEISENKKIELSPNIELYKNSFIKLYYFTCKSNASNSNYKFSIELFEQMKKMNSLITQFERYKKDWAEEFNNYAKAIDDSYNILSQSADDFKKSHKVLKTIKLK